MRLVCCHDGGNGVFENQLLLVTGFEYDAVLVEATHSSGQLDTAGEKDRNRQPLAPGFVQERILYVVVGHSDCSLPRAALPFGGLYSLLYMNGNQVLAAGVSKTTWRGNADNTY